MLQAGASDYFSGLWVEHTPDYRLVVQITSSASADEVAALEAVLEGLPLATELRLVDYTLADLIAEVERINSQLRVPADLLPNVIDNRVDVFVTSLGDVDGLLSPMSRAYVAPRRSSPIVNIHGGLTLSGGGCTSGFSVFSLVAGVRGVTTAGHCSNIQSYSGTNLPFQAGTWAGSADIQWHTAPGFTVVNKIFISGATIRNVTSTKSLSAMFIGESVCKTGATTGLDCGSISALGLAPGFCVPNPLPTWVQVHSASGNDMGAPGDSGGPVYTTSGATDARAYGTLACEAGPGNLDMIFMAQEKMSSINVVVLTS